MIVSAFINIRNPSDMFSYLYYDLYDGFWYIFRDEESSISCVLVGLSFQTLFLSISDGSFSEKARV